MLRNRQEHAVVSRAARVLLAGAGSALLLLALWQQIEAQPPGAGKAQTLRGVVERFTTAKKGEVDGCLLDDGTWVHWPPHLAEQVAPFLAKGDRIRVTGRTEIDKKGETKFEAETIINLRSNRSVFIDDDGPKGPNGRKGEKGRKGRRPLTGEATVLRGVVARFTTAPKGETDGFVMDDGTWVHWPPHLQDRVKEAFSKGDRVRVAGWWKTGKKGETKFEAQWIVNLRNDKSVRFDERAEMLQRPAAAGATRAERLRELERRLDALLREMKDLRGER